MVARGFALRSRPKERAGLSGGMGLSLALTAQRESKGTRFIIQVERGMLGRPLGVVERARWAITVKGLLTDAA